jgi:hypothetical protein
VHRLVVVGRWGAVADDIAPLSIRPMRHFQESIRRDGIRKVRGPGKLRHDCPANPGLGLGTDCFVYRLSGRQEVPTQGVTLLDARYRLWVDYEDGRWQAVTYDYDLKPAG